MALADTITEIGKLVDETISTFGVGSKETLEALEKNKDKLDKGVQEFRKQAFNYGQNTREYLRVRRVVDELIDQIEALQELLSEDDPDLDSGRQMIESFKDRFEQEIEDTVPLDLGPGNAGRLEASLDSIESEMLRAQINLSPQNSNVAETRGAVSRVDDHLNDVYRRVDQYFLEVAKDLRAAA